MKKAKVIYTAIVVTILIFAMSNIAFAKYYNVQSTRTASKIASPIIEVTSENEENKIITSNSGIDLILNVANYNDSSISEVGQNYYIQFYSNDIDISKVNITVTKDEKSIYLENGKTLKTFIGAGKKERHKYNVKITSNSSEEVKGNIQAKIVSEQIEPK